MVKTLALLVLTLEEEVTATSLDGTSSSVADVASSSVLASSAVASVA